MGLVGGITTPAAAAAASAAVCQRQRAVAS